MFSALLLTPSFVLNLSPTEVKQVADLKKEKEALQSKLADNMKEKADLEREITKLRLENADLDADVETLKEWSEALHKRVKILDRDFENLFDDIRDKVNLFTIGTDHTDNCDVSVLIQSITVCLMLVNSQGIAIVTFSQQ